MSSAISVKSILTDYLAGRATADRLAEAVAAVYYRETRNGKRETWRPIMDVVERAHPGVVELTATDRQPGFEVRVAERRFPKRYEAELRQAVERVLQACPVSRVPYPEQPTPQRGLVGRIVAAIRRVFSA
jgi:hypothetical protein